MASDSEEPSQHPQTLDPETFPNKRLKTLTLTLTSPSSKGKAKCEEPKHESQEEEHEESSMDSDSDNCGICLSEEGKSIRGWIDSCDHYFCFVCIMEWAKVESRCPMCKRRFTTIRRPAKDRVFPSERIVNVPVRDQVYHPLGNTTISYPDPYAQVQCTVCHGMSDESLLLLCDLCDSASHTYCVGLGATVPEGDWFCHDCTVSRVDHSNSEIDTDCDNQRVSRKSFMMPLAEAHISIFDIVRESNILDVERPPTIASSHLNQLSSPMVSDREISVANEVTEPGARTVRSVADKATETGARTLSRCRNVNGCIRSLRENWNALRSGSLGFSSSSVDSGGKSGQTLKIGAVLCDRSGQPHSSSSTTSQPLITQNGCSSDTLHNRGSHDIDKAWKMMDIAKSIQRTCGRTSIVHQSSEYAIGKGNAPKEASNINSNFLVPKSQPVRTRDLGSNEKHFKYHSLKKENEKHESQKFEKQKPSRVTMKGTLKINEGFPTTHSEGYFEFPSARKVQTLVRVDACHGNGGELPQKILNGASSNVVNERDGSACLLSQVMPVTIVSDLSYARPELSASSSCKVDLPGGKGRVENGSLESKARKDDDAKSEIQSLVKLNLKLLSKNKHLGVDEFKEVARLATHTIMAACGLEHPKSGVRSFPSSVCCHSEQIQQLRKSTLMPSSCRECFYVFVKDIVNSIMFEKVGHVKSC